MSVALTYPSISGVSGAPNVPAMSDVADIQTALKYLYYGSTATENTSNGIYGLLYNLKQYVDASVSGINVHEVVKYATTAALGTTGNLVGGTITTTYANGTADASGGLGIGATLTIATSSNWTAITIDGQSLTVNDRVLIKNQAAALQNGIYLVTSVGAVGNTTSFVFTRSEDSNNSIAGEMGEGDFMFVVNGSTLGNTSWVLTSASPTGTGPAGSIMIGTDPVTYQQYSGVGTYYVGTTAATVTPGSMNLAGIQSVTGYPGLSMAIATPANLSGASTALTLGTGTGTSSTGSVTISTGAPNDGSAGVSGAITISTSNGSGSGGGASGAITITTGNGSGSGGGSGSVAINAGAAVNSGSVRLADTSGGLQLGRTGITISVPGIINTIISGTSVTNALWAENAGGTITVGAGLTTGTLTLGGTTNITTGTRTINLATGGVTTSGTTQIVNIGTTAPSAGATSSINIGATGATTTVTGTLTVPNTSFTYAKLQNVSAQYRVLGRITAGAGVIEELTPDNLMTTVNQATTALEVGNGGTGTTTAPSTFGIIYASSTSSYASTAGGTSSQFLSGNTGSAPTWASSTGSGNVVLATSPTIASPTITGGMTITSDDIILKTASFTVGAGEKNFNVTGTASVTVTLPTATAGREINIVNKAAFTIVSSATNIIPRTSNTATTAICAATPGSWARLVADGSNWYIIAGG